MKPDKNLFIVTSALEPTIGVISKEDRFQQTVAGLKNLKEKVPNAFILFSDGSPGACDDNSMKQIAKFIDGAVYWSHDDQVRELSKTGRKSEAEIALLLKTFFLLKQHPELSKLMYSVKRIFKYSARSLLQDKFNISVYDNANLFGKYLKFPINNILSITEIPDDSTTTIKLINQEQIFCKNTFNEIIEKCIGKY